MGIQARYLYGDSIDQILARERSDGLASYLPDHLGTIEDIINITEEQDLTQNDPRYSGFGGIMAEEGAEFGDRFKFTGREWDAEVNLFYYRARYYDPGLGRFISEDPIRLKAGDPNIYRYGFNSPIFFSDPTGETSTFLYWGAGAAGGALGGYLLCQGVGEVLAPVKLIQTQVIYGYTISGDVLEGAALGLTLSGLALATGFSESLMTLGAAAPPIAVGAVGGLVICSFGYGPNRPSE